jgi:hypothetical protein
MERRLNARRPRRSLPFSSGACEDAMTCTVTFRSVVLTRESRGWRVLNAPKVGAFLPDMEANPLHTQPGGREFLRVDDDVITLRGWDRRTVVYRLRAPNAPAPKGTRLGDKVYDDLDEGASAA